MVKVDRVKPVSVAGSEEAAIGGVWVAVSSAGVVVVQIGGNETGFIQGLVKGNQIVVGDHKIQAQEAVLEIIEYLQGRRKQFELRIDWSVMSSFQTAVLQTVNTIPYGKTRTYGQVAALIGKPGAARAVGQANATNPMPLVIPCHRVIAAHGKLQGYSAGEGLKTKAWLLSMEKGNIE